MLIDHQSGIAFERTIRCSEGSPVGLSFATKGHCAKIAAESARWQRWNGRGNRDSPDQRLLRPLRGEQITSELHSYRAWAVELEERVRWASYLLWNPNFSHPLGNDRNPRSSVPNLPVGSRPDYPGKRMSASKRCRPEADGLQSTPSGHSLIGVYPVALSAALHSGAAIRVPFGL